MLDKSNYREFLTPGMKIVVVVLELVDEKPRLMAHGKDGNSTFVGYTMVGATTFLVIDNTRGTGRKTQITESLAINTSQIVYLLPYSGPPKI